jgi:hypothetical protein
VTQLRVLRSGERQNLRHVDRSIDHRSTTQLFPFPNYALVLVLRQYVLQSSVHATSFPRATHVTIRAFPMRRAILLEIDR